MKLPRVGIAGATGFIGSYLTHELLETQNGPLRVLTRRPEALDRSERIQVVKGDLQSRESCEEFVAGLDVIYHLAHNNSPVNSDQDQSEDTRLNLIPSLNLFQASVTSGRVIHFVYFSTAGAMYSAAGGRVPFQESDPALPTSSYGIQKLAIENYLRLAASRHQLTTTVLRIGNAFGALLPRHRMQGLIGVGVAAALAKKPIRIFGSLDNVRDYIHLRDICSIAWMARQPKESFALYNIGSGKGHSVGEVLDLIRECYRGDLRVERSAAATLGLTDWVVLNIDKVRSEFGWSPTIDLRSGIRLLMPEAWSSSPQARGVPPSGFPLSVE